MAAIPVNPAPWLRVARIVRPQGHRGEVVAELLTDFPERFHGRPTVSLRPEGAEEPVRAAVVESFRPHSGRVVFKFAGCDSMNEAELLRGYEVVVPWAERAKLAEDEVYIAELAGCTLLDAGTGARIGTVTDVDRESGAGELLVVEAEGGREVLVPFVKAFEPCWDLASRTLTMRLPAGLIDLGAADEV